MKKFIFALVISFFLLGCTDPTPVKDVNGIEANSAFTRYLPEGFTNLELIDTHWGYFTLDNHKYLMFVEITPGGNFATAVTLVE